MENLFRKFTQSEQSLPSNASFFCWVQSLEVDSPWWDWAALRRQINWSCLHGERGVLLNAAPTGPKMRRRTKCLVIHVDAVVITRRGIAMAKLVDVTREMIITEHLVQSCWSDRWDWISPSMYSKITAWRASDAVAFWEQIQFRHRL